MLFKGPQRKVCQPYAVDLGLGLVQAPFIPDPNDHYNMECAFRKRIAPVMPTGNRKVIRALSAYVHRWMDRHLKPLDPIEHLDRQLFVAWLEDNRSYNQRRKQELLDAYNKLWEKGYPILVRKDYDCKSFLKRECYETYKYPRMINSRSDKFKARVAAYVHLIEKEVYKQPQFVKGQRIDELPTKLVRLRRYPWILETDYSSFESGFSPMYTRAVEEALFEHMLKYNPHVLADILSAYRYMGRPVQQKLVGRDYTAHVTGTRMSGDMWTSLCNGFSNLMNAKFFAHRKHIKIEGFVEGDDGIFGMEQPVFTEDDYKSLGFVIKMNYGQDLSHTCFCGNLFVPEEMKILIEPEQIMRLDWSIDAASINYSKSVRLDLLLAKAQSLYVLGKHTPIASWLAYTLILRLKGHTPRREQSNRWWTRLEDEIWSQTKLVPPTVSMKARLLYQQMFGIPVQVQLDLESSIRNSCGLPSFIYPLVKESYVEGIRFE